MLHCAVLAIGDAVLLFEFTVAVWTSPTDWSSDKIDVDKNILEKIFHAHEEIERLVIATCIPKLDIYFVVLSHIE
jgi:hypothetical protein